MSTGAFSCAFVPTPFIEPAVPLPAMVAASPAGETTLIRWLLVSATYKSPEEENFRPLAPLYRAVVELPSIQPATLPLKSVKPLGAATRIFWQASYMKTTPLGLTAMAPGLYV